MDLTIFTLIVLLFSIVAHEIAHGSVAYSLGDPTAKEAGRLTLNPIKHLDPFGSILLPLILFLANFPVLGWAKPVPINPYNFSDKKWGILKVSLAGPLMNFLIAIFFALIIRFFSLSESFLTFLSIIALYNFDLGLFNLIPIPPFDGFHIFFQFLPEKFSNIKIFFQRYSLYILLLFIIFGLQLIFWGAQFFYTLISGHVLIL